MIIYFDAIDSTNEEAKRQYKERENGTIFCAKTQTHGKGRLGRTWCDGYGESILMSILCKGSTPSLLTLRAGLCVFLVLKSIGVNNISLKWPNDIYINNKKVCGILCEGVPGEYFVVGIGINALQKAFPHELENTATSLLLEGVTVCDFDKLMQIIKDKLFELFETADEEIIWQYRINCLNIGKEVYTNTASGTCIDIAPDGCLVVKTKDGNVLINSGEVCIYNG